MLYLLTYLLAYTYISYLLALILNPTWAGEGNQEPPSQNDNLSLVLRDKYLVWEIADFLKTTTTQCKFWKFWLCAKNQKWKQKISLICATNVCVSLRASGLDSITIIGCPLSQMKECPGILCSLSPSLNHPKHQSKERERAVLTNCVLVGCDYDWALLYYPLECQILTWSVTQETGSTHHFLKATYLQRWTQNCSWHKS